MAHYRINAIVQTDVEEGDIGYILEKFLENRFHGLEDLSVWEVTHLPSDYERQRAERGLG